MYIQPYSEGVCKIIGPRSEMQPRLQWLVRVYRRTTPYGVTTNGSVGVETPVLNYILRPPRDFVCFAQSKNSPTRFPPSAGRTTLRRQGRVGGLKLQGA